MRISATSQVSIRIHTMDPEGYLKQRVDDQLDYYEDAANRAKKAYSRMQVSIIVLGLLVPVLINIPSHWGPDMDVTVPIQIAVTLLSLSLAVLNGILNFKKYGDLWLSYRMTEELLKHEKFLFLTGTSKYEQPESSFPEFVRNIEAIISAEHNQFRALTEEVNRSNGTLEHG